MLILCILYFMLFLASFINQTYPTVPSQFWLNSSCYFLSVCGPAAKSGLRLDVSLSFVVIWKHFRRIARPHFEITSRKKKKKKKKNDIWATWHNFSSISKNNTKAYKQTIYWTIAHRKSFTSAVIHVREAKLWRDAPLATKNMKRNSSHR